MAVDTYCPDRTDIMAMLRQGCMRVLKHSYCGHSQERAHKPTIRKRVERVPYPLISLHGVMLTHFGKHILDGRALLIWVPRKEYRGPII